MGHGIHPHVVGAAYMHGAPRDGICKQQCIKEGLLVILIKKGSYNPDIRITVSAPHTPLFYGIHLLLFWPRLFKNAAEAVLSTPHSCRTRCSPGYVRICVVSPPALFLPCLAPPSLLPPPILLLLSSHWWVTVTCIHCTHHTKLALNLSTSS